MTLDLAVVTCVSSNYLAYARALVRSIRLLDQDVEICVVVSDGDGRDYLRQQNVFCISGYELGIDNWQRFAFQYTAFELCCALKPFALRAILERGFSSAIYADSDIHFKASPRLILREFSHGDVILSPHVLSPIPDDGHLPRGEVFATHGIFNGGFVAIKKSETCELFLEWWSNRCLTKSHVDVRGGIFVDQLWLNHAPVFFPGCVATRNPGINAAYWNLHERVIQYDGSKALSNDETLIFFHFSGFDVHDEHSLSRYQTRYKLADLDGLRRLVEEYKRILVECGCGKAPDFDYAFDTLTDGTRIRKVWREVVRAQLSELSCVDDPFSVENNKRLKSRLEKCAGRASQLREDWRANGARVFMHRVATLPLVRGLWSRWVEHES